jgi:hypothetical protein
MYAVMPSLGTESRPTTVGLPEFVMPRITLLEDEGHRLIVQELDDGNSVWQPLQPDLASQLSLLSAMAYDLTIIDSDPLVREPCNQFLFVLYQELNVLPVVC